MNRFNHLHLGLWIRMALACVITFTGIGLLLATELVLGGLMGIFLAEAIPVYAGIGIAIAVGGFMLLGIWWLGANLLGRVVPAGILTDRIAHGGMADAVAGVRRGLGAPTRLLPPRRLVMLAGGSFLILLAHQILLERWQATSFQLGVVVGCFVVFFQSGRFITREFRQDSTVHATLADEFRVIDNPDRQAALNARVRRLATQAGIPTPTVEIGAARTPLAATVGYRPAESTILISSGLLEALNDREQEAVLAHELAHISNRDAAMMTVLALPAAKAKTLIDRFSHPLLLVVVAPVYVSTRLCVALVGRYREYVADRSAAAITGNPAVLASALEQLSDEQDRHPANDLRNHRSTVAFAIVPPPWDEHRFFDRTRRFVARRLLGTHPPTAARIERLRDRREDHENELRVS